MNEGHLPAGHIPVTGLPTLLGGAQSPLWWEDNNVAGPKAGLCIDTNGTTVD
jgi:hypothetical protein